MIQMKLISY